MHNNSAARFLFHPVCSKALPIAWISVAARRLRKLAPRVPIKFDSLIFFDLLRCSAPNRNVSSRPTTLKLSRFETLLIIVASPSESHFRDPDII